MREEIIADRDLISVFLSKFQLSFGSEHVGFKVIERIE